MAAEIKFIRGSKPADLTGLNQHAIYFFTDTQEIYMGGKIYGVDPATISDIQGEIAALQATDTTQGEKITALENWMATAKTQISNNASAAEAASNTAAAAQADVDDLTELVGTLPEDATAQTVIAYVDEKTAGIATEGAMTALANRVTAAEGAIDAIENDYLKGADKTELEGKITAEAEARAAADTALDERLVEVETFFKTAEGETLDTALDTLVEIQKYVTTEGSKADQMVKDIAANAAAITKEAENRAAADEALQGNIDKKADSTVVEGLAGRVTTAEGNITTLQGDVVDAKNQADKGVADAAAALAAAQAADGKAVAVQSEVDALEVEVAKKAAQADLTAAVARVEAAEGEIDALQDASHTHGNKTVLDGITSAKVSAWDVAETNAKSYADSLLAWGQL